MLRLIESETMCGSHCKNMQHYFKSLQLKRLYQLIIVLIWLIMWSVAPDVLLYLLICEVLTYDTPLREVVFTALRCDVVSSYHCMSALSAIQSSSYYTLYMPESNFVC